jgi:group II intron reverse transcriptase/maturase
MQTSLQGIAEKARRDKKYRFRDLYRLLNEENLVDSWKCMNLKAASGVDRTTAREYKENLRENIRALAARLKEKRYRAKLVRRVYIPKSNGKLRPLGIPATEDKLVQTVAARILNAIFEQDFLPVSFGYRPDVGAREAVQALTSMLYWGRFNYLVDADIKGFFDTIDHDWLIRMLEQRIDDKAFIGLIRKWLKAGVLLPEGRVEQPATGTPQGGIVSPVLANIYLHYVLDLWFEKVVKPRCEGEAYLCRYADDFMAAFHYKGDAERFYEALEKRLLKFGLTVAVDKTRVLRFTRFRKAEGVRFEFLGFEFRWGTDRKGRDVIKRRTSRTRFRKSLKNLTEWCRESRCFRLVKLFSLLNSKLRGYYNYYGVIGNWGSLKEFYELVRRILYKWLNRRSQKRSFNYSEFSAVLKRYRIEKPRITEKLHTKFTSCGLDLLRERVSLKSPVR